MNKLTKVLLCGSNGRMGREIKNVASQYKCEIVYEANRASDLQEMCSLPIDLCIDFSSPAGLKRLLTFACDVDLPVISGTTGLTQSDFDCLKKAAEKIKILYASNFSVGVFAFKKAVELVAPILSDKFSVDIIERHHVTKIDAPSGTAKTIGESLINLGVKSNIHSLRSGDCKGEHSVVFGGIGESLTFSHATTDRFIFAHGAMSCVGKFLNINAAGLYTLDDILVHK